MEKKILQINKGVGNEEFNSLIQEKDVEIQNLKKQLKLPSEGPVQTVELKKYPSEKGSFTDSTTKY